MVVSGVDGTGAPIVYTNPGPAESGKNSPESATG